MKLNPVWDAEISLISADVKVERKRHYIVVRSNEYPDHIWKNFLLFPSSPTKETFNQWMSAYTSEFRGRSFSVAFGWNRFSKESGETEFLENLGFAADHNIAFISRKPSEPPGQGVHVSIKPIRNELDWEKVLLRRIDILCTGPHKDLQAKFEVDKFASYRALVARGRGDWYVASVQDIEVGDMGIFLSDEKKGSVEEVLVYPAARGKGVAPQLIKLSCDDFEAKHAPASFIILGNESASVHRLCSAVGFAAHGKIERVYWHKFMQPLDRQIYSPRP